MKTFFGMFAAFLVIGLAYCVSSPTALSSADKTDTVFVHDTLYDTLYGVSNMVCGEAFSRTVCDSVSSPGTRLWTLTGFACAPEYHYIAEVSNSPGVWATPAAFQCALSSRSDRDGLREFILQDNFNSLSGAVWRITVYK